MISGVDKPAVFLSAKHTILSYKINSILSRNSVVPDPVPGQDWLQGAAPWGGSASGEELTDWPWHSRVVPILGMGVTNSGVNFQEHCQAGCISNCNLNTQITCLR